MEHDTTVRGESIFFIVLNEVISILTIELQVHHVLSWFKSGLKYHEPEKERFAKNSKYAKHYTELQRKY